MSSKTARKIAHARTDDRYVLRVLVAMANRRTRWIRDRIGSDSEKRFNNPLFLIKLCNLGKEDCNWNCLKNQKCRA
jgi:hypothetical protein